MTSVMEATTIYYLEMNSVDDFRQQAPACDLLIMESEIKDYRTNEFLYKLVGANWRWIDKLDWSSDQWLDYAESDQLRTWIAYYRGSIAGYFELFSCADGSVEIAYFGLVAKFIGQGFGAYLLSRAVRLAWHECDANRVWLHTCSDDHPHALSNYQARGFKIYHIENT